MGIVAGVASALLVALFGTLNKRMVDGGDPLTVTALELGGHVDPDPARVPLMPVLVPAFAGPVAGVLLSAIDGFWLVLLALACTLFPFALCLGRAAPSERVHRAVVGGT